VIETLGDEWYAYHRTHGRCIQASSSGSLREMPYCLTLIWAENKRKAVINNAENCVSELASKAEQNTCFSPLFVFCESAFS